MSPLRPNEAHHDEVFSDPTDQRPAWDDRAVWSAGMQGPSTRLRCRRLSLVHLPRSRGGLGTALPTPRWAPARPVQVGRLVPKPPGLAGCPWTGRTSISPRRRRWTPLLLVIARSSSSLSRRAGDSPPYPALVRQAPAQSTNSISFPASRACAYCAHAAGSFSRLLRNARATSASWALGLRPKRRA